VETNTDYRSRNSVLSRLAERGCSSVGWSDSPNPALESLSTQRLLAELERIAAFLRDGGIGDAAVAVESAARRIRNAG